MITEFVNHVVKNVEYIGIEVLIGVLIAVILGVGAVVRNKLGTKRRLKFVKVFSTYVPNENVELVIKTELNPKKTFTDDTIYYKRSLLKAIVENPSIKTIPVARTWLVVDKVSPFQVRELEVLGHLMRGKFVVYVVNNGYSDIENINIHLQGNIDTDDGKERLTDDQLAKLLCCGINDLYFTISKLIMGEINCIAEFFVDVRMLTKYSQGRNWIYICKDVTYDQSIQRHYNFLASLVLNNNQLGVIYSEGDGMDIERYQVEVYMENKFPEMKELPVEFAVDSKKYMQIQVATSVDQSGTIQYHFEIEPAGMKKVISEQKEVNIAVPVYKTDGGYFYELREWLDKNNIISYKYNDNPIIQKDIEYKMSLQKAE